MKEKENDFKIEFISGLLGGIFSVSLCHPLDISRTRLNV